jgi:DNA ligase 1
MPKIFRPMLAAPCAAFDCIKYPVYATPKIDGIRCLTIKPDVIRGIDQRCKPVTRQLEPIPNLHVRSLLECLPVGLDGELVSGTSANGSFNGTSSDIMSEEGWPEFRYIVFDFGHQHIFDTDRQTGYLSRIKLLQQLTLSEHCIVLEPVCVNNPDELRAYEQAVLQQGYEGVMIRQPDSPYKFGRSTINEQYLLKIKQFEDSEAEVIGFQEKLHNSNEPTINPLGYQERSTHQDNMLATGVLGALCVRDIKTGVEFKIGTGFDDLQREQIWRSRESYLGLIAKYKHQPHGRVDKPRFPVFIGWRDVRDL